MEKEIRNQIIDEVILSNDIRTYWKKLNYDLTDLQWLNVIIHNYKNIESLYKLLNILKSNTKYKRIQKYIDKIIECQKQAINIFQTNNAKCIYEIKLQNKNNNKYYSLGYTDNWKDVLEISKDAIKQKYTTNIIVQKLKFITSLNRYSHNYIGDLKFNDKLDIIYCSINKYDIYFDIIANTSMDVGVLFTHPFKRNDRVRNIITNKAGTIISGTNLKPYKNFINISYENILFKIKYDDGEIDDMVNMFNLEKIKEDK